METFHLARNPRNEKSNHNNQTSRFIRILEDTDVMQLNAAALSSQGLSSIKTVGSTHCAAQIGIEKIIRPENEVQSFVSENKHLLIDQTFNNISFRSHTILLGSPWKRHENTLCLNQLNARDP